jgi:FkbM family methyltransferase
MQYSPRSSAAGAIQNGRRRTLASSSISGGFTASVLRRAFRGPVRGMRAAAAAASTALRRRRFWRHTPQDALRVEFYRQFVAPGDLVFDVGANLGTRSKIFHLLGARVVAVEPQQACASYLEAMFSGKHGCCLVRKALGSAPGTAVMHISSSHTISSMAASWVQAVQASGRFGGATWDATEIVPVETLDNLIAEQGTPAFVKIDVEGFEESVLQGLSAPVRALSLEFTPECIESTLQCIDRLCELGVPRFQLSLGESMEFAEPAWVEAAELKRRLQAVPRWEFGDIYARFNVADASAPVA